MSSKYKFNMVVIKPTGKDGKPLKPKPIKPKNKSEGGMSNKPKEPKKVIKIMPEGVIYKGKAKDYPGIKELIKKKNKKALGGEMLKNPKKADLDKDGKLSSYEKKRGMAIENNMKPKKAMDGGMMKRGYGAARSSGMGLQDENLVPGKTMDYYKDLM